MDFSARARTTPSLQKPHRTRETRSITVTERCRHRSSSPRSTRSQPTLLHSRKSCSTTSMASSAGTLTHSASYRRRISPNRLCPHLWLDLSRRTKNEDIAFLHTFRDSLKGTPENQGRVWVPELVPQGRSCIAYFALALQLFMKSVNNKAFFNFTLERETLGILQCNSIQSAKYCNPIGWSRATELGYIVKCPQ